MDELDIRYSNEKTDYPYLLQWLKDPEINKCFIVKKDKEVEEYAKNWIGFSKFRASLTGMLDNKPVAIATLFLMPYKKLRHICMFYIVVDKKHWRKGIGTDMLKNIVNLAEKYFQFESIYVETFEGCFLIPLLKKNGFEEFANQEMFLKDDNKYSSRILLDKWFK